MGVRESAALPGQAVHVGRSDLRVRVEAAHISIAHVIGHDEDDVRTLSSHGADQEKTHPKKTETVHGTTLRTLRLEEGAAEP